MPLVLLSRAVSLYDRQKPSIWNALHCEVFEQVKIPYKHWFAHQITRIALVCLLSSMPFLVTNAQIGMIRKVEACSLIFRSIEQFDKLIDKKTESLISLKCQILERCEIDFSYLVHFDIIAHSCNMRASFRLNCHKKVAPHNVDYSQDSHTIKIELLLFFNCGFYNQSEKSNKDGWCMWEAVFW